MSTENRGGFETTPELNSKGVIVGVMGPTVLLTTSGPRGKFATLTVAEARDMATLLGAAIGAAEAGATQKGESTP